MQVSHASLLLVGAVWLASVSSSFGADEPATLSLHDLDGAPVDLEEHRGRVVVLNFWATWCLPCREEMPLLSDVRERFGDRGVEVIAASADDETTRMDVPGFVRRHHLPFPVWVGATVEDMRRLGLGDALPATAILDAEGRIAFRIRGMLSRDDLEDRIGFLLGDAVEPVPDRDLDTFSSAGDDHDEAHTEGHDEAHGHDHEGHGDEEDHDHGGVGMEGASLVPS